MISLRKSGSFWCVLFVSILAIVFSVKGTAESTTADDVTQTTDSAEFIKSLSQPEQAWLRTHPVIRVVQDPGWPPVEFTDERGEPSGMSADYLNLIKQRLGVRFEVVHNLQWAEAYAQLKSWDIDMTTSVAVTPQRTEFWAFTEPYLTIPIVIATQSDVTYIADIQELFGKKVAVVTGYALEDWVSRDYPQIHLVSAKTTLEGLEMLQRGEVFAYLDNLLIIGDYQAKLKVTNIKIAGQTPYVNAQCMAVRKDWALFAGILQKALASIPQTERDNIYRKWLPVRYEHGFNYVLFWKVLSIFTVIILVLVFWNRKLTKEIQSRKHAEKSLLESEERHRRYIVGAPYGVFVTDDLGRCLQINPSACRITGYDEDELLLMSIFDLIFEYDIEEGKRHFEKVIRDREAQSEMLFHTKNGVKRWWSLTTVRISNTRLLSFSDDITERKVAEEKILETHALLNSVIEGTTDAIYVKDVSGRYLLVNSGTCNAIGKEKHEIIGKNDRELFPLESADIINKIDHEVVTSAKTVLAEEKLETAYGLTYWLVNKSPFFNEANEVIGLIGISRNITSIKKAEEEKNQLQQQLNQAQKMESVGQLAGGVAHDFNNMLGVILGHAEMAMELVVPTTPIYSDLDEISKAAKRSAAITRQLLAFARKQPIAPKVLDVNETVSGMIGMLRRLIGEDIDLTWLPGEDLCRVNMDPSQIDQILFNLCVNARDAILGVGKMTIETGNISLDNDYCISHAGFVPGNYVRIAVSDNGSGMDKETLSHIFEPFFTTKGTGKGTGLGLATVYGTVKQNNGSISVYSEPGNGTTFTIYLPQHPGTDSDIQPDAEVKPAVGGHETILLVEDELAILKMTATMLQNLGYTVLEANGPVQAIDMVQEIDEEIDILLTDVIMPDMNGWDLMDRLIALQPKMKCIFMSGYTANVIASHGVLQEGVHYIQKPFSKTELAIKVRQALAADVRRMM